MAYPTALNNQITDAITQVDVMSIGVAPGVAMGNLYTASASALSNAAHNATTIQQNMAALYEAVTATGTAVVYAQKPK